MLFSYLKNRIIKEKKAMAVGFANILNGVILHSVNSGSGFYIGDLKDKYKK